MNKKNIFLICLGLLLIFFFVYVSITDFNLFSLATDSGFDTDYGGGSGGGYSGGYGSGSMLDLIIFAFYYPVQTFLVLTITFFVYLAVWFAQITKKRNYDNNLNYQFIEEKYSHTSDKEILKQSYQIFCDVQIAWMNFDYNRLKELVTDELYNMYYNELETLKLKGQCNIMEGFRVKDITLVSTKEENDVIEYCVNLKVSFFDYIVNNAGKVVRGHRSSYHTMSYLLTFASSLKKLECCPNCSAPLPENSICEHCGSHVQGLRTMRLVKKMNIKQERIN